MRWLLRLPKIVLLAVVTLLGFVALTLVCIKLYMGNERLARLVASQLNARFAGRFAVREIQWSLPFHFVIDDVAIDDPEGRPALRATHLEAALDIRELFAGTLAIDDITGHGIDVQVLAAERQPAELGIVAAFAPKEAAPSPPPGAAEGAGITLDFHAPIVDAIDFTYDDGATRFAVSGGHLEGVHFAMHGDLLEVDADASVTRGAFLADGFSYEDGPLALHAEHFTIDTGNELGLGARAAKLTAGALVVDASGEIKIPARGPLVRGDLRFDVTVPLEHAVVRAALEDVLPASRRLTGNLMARGRLAETRLELERLAVDVDGGTLATMGEVTLEAPFPHDVELELEHFPVSDVLGQPMLPRRCSGHARARGEGLAELASRVEATLQASGFPRDLAVIPDPLRVDIEADLSPKHADILRAVVQGDGARLDASGRVPFDAHGSFDTALKLVHERPGATLAKATTSRALQLEALTLDAKAKGTLARLEAEATLTARGVTASGTAPADVRLPVRLTQGVLNISGATIDIAGGSLTLDGTLGLLDEHGRLRADMAIDAKVAATKLDLAKLTRDKARGSVVVDGELHGTLQAPRGGAHLEVTDLVIQGITFTRARAEVAVTPESIDVKELSLVPEHGGGLAGHAHYALRTRDVDAEIGINALPLVAVTALSGSAITPRGDLNGRLTVKGGPARAAVNAQIAIADAGNLHIDGVIAPDAGRVDAKVELRDVGIARALAVANLALPLDGNVTADVQIHGALPYPAVTGDIGVSHLLIDGETPTTDTITVALSTDDADSRYDARVDFGKILSATARVWPRRGPTAELDARFEALRVSAFSPKLAKAGYDLELSGETDVRYAAPHTLNGTFTLTQLAARAGHQSVELAKPTTITFDGTRVEVPALTLAGAGSTVTVGGSMRDGVIDAQADGDLDLAVIGPFVTAISEPSGLVHVSAKANGPTSAPRFSGELRIAKEVRCRPRALPEELVVNDGRIVFSGDSIIIQDLHGRLDTGEIAVHGRVGLAGLRPDSYDVHVRGTKLGLQTRELRVEADGDLHLTGRGVVPDIKGEIVVVTGRYFKKFALKDFNFVGREPDTSAPLSQTAPFLSEMELDIHAINGEDVVVAVDAGAFAISLPLQLDLRVRGTPLSPAVSGKVSALAGAIKFPEATLAVQETLVTFTQGLPPSEGANISLVAEGEVRSRGEDATADEVYLVSMTLSGTLAAMQFDLSAAPGLDRNQTLALLITGRAGFDQLFYGSSTTTGTASGNSTSPEVDAAIALAGAGVTGPLTGFVENQLEDRLNLKVDLMASFTSEQVRVTARKELTSRLRLEGSVQRALQTTGTNLNVATATFVLGNRWFLQALAQTAQGNVITDSSVVRPRSDSRLEMRYRLIGD